MAGWCELATSTNLDLITLTGGNTADVCSLYDTDNDNNVNLAVCITLGGMPATQQDVRLFTCGDTAPDKCTGSVQIRRWRRHLSNANCPLGQMPGTSGPCSRARRPTSLRQLRHGIDLNDAGGASSQIPNSILRLHPFDGNCNSNLDCDGNAARRHSELTEPRHAPNGSNDVCTNQLLRRHGTCNSALRPAWRCRSRFEQHAV
jgi:hypothetical protein